MFDKLKKFLQDQENITEQEMLKDYKDVWENKSDFVWDILYMFSLVTEAYQNIGTTDSYNEKLKELINTDIEVRKSKINKSDPPNFEAEEKIFIEIFKQLLTPNYEPPTHPALLQYHLRALWLFYKYLSPAIPIQSVSLRHRFDYVLARVAYETAVSSSDHYRKGKGSERIRKSTFTISKKKQKSMQEVFEAFYRVEDRSKKKPHTIAREIRSQLGKIKKAPPSVETIKRYLKKEKLI